MDRVLIIRSESGTQDERYAVIVDDDEPRYFPDLRLAADWLKASLQDHA